MARTQDDLFESGEGDRWFQRNRYALGTHDWPLELCRRNSIQPDSVLEIGCANGWRLAKFDARRSVGVDISRLAIEEGKAQFPELDLRVGKASQLPICGDETFDLVIVNYVLHWIDRSLLLSSLAEADRCVGEYLIIGDFLPDRPTRVPYHHLEEAEVFTFKLDYSAIFVALSIYEVVDREIYNHDDPTSEPSSQNRGACTLLRKSLIDLYELKASS